MALTQDQMIAANGFSNEYLGWGGEDDDFYRRLIDKRYNIVRLSPPVSSYRMQPHAVSKLLNVVIIIIRNSTQLLLPLNKFFRFVAETGSKQKL